MAAARHGAAVEMIGCLGEDGFGERLRERLAAAGVGLRHMRTVAAGSGMSVALTAGRWRLRRGRGLRRQP